MAEPLDSENKRLEQPSTPEVAPSPPHSIRVQLQIEGASVENDEGDTESALTDAIGVESRLEDVGIPAAEIDDPYASDARTGDEVILDGMPTEVPTDQLLDAEFEMPNSGDADNPRRDDFEGIQPLPLALPVTLADAELLIGRAVEAAADRIAQVIDERIDYKLREYAERKASEFRASY